MLRILESTKKVSSILFLLASVLIKVQAQTAWIANNNPGASGGQNVKTGATALTNAIAAASPGDVIYVIPSTISYGTITVTKKLSINGIGLNPNTQGTNSTIVDYFYIADAADYSVISGFKVNTYFELGSASNQAIKGILIENCNFNNGIYIYDSNSDSIKDVTIRNNLFNGSSTNIRISLYKGITYNLTSNISITNNIIMVPNNGSYGAIFVQGGAIIANNLFVSNGGSGAFAFEAVNNSVIKNNIFYGVQPFAVGGINNKNSFIHNMSFGANNNSFPVGTSGNIGDSTFVNTDPKLVNVPSGQTQWNFAYDPHPSTATGSPATGAGDDNSDIGITGGPVPFNFSGSRLPVIQSVDLQSVIIRGGTLTPTIKATGN